jgi:hypothetical protein
VKVGVETPESLIPEANHDVDLKGTHIDRLCEVIA